MSVAQLHPEDLIDRARRGQLAEEERARLDAHARRCSACALELGMMREALSTSGGHVDDEARIARLVTNVLAHPRASGPSVRDSRTRRVVRILAIAAAALLVLGTIAAAATFVRRRRVVETPREVTPIVAASPPVGSLPGAPGPLPTAPTDAPTEAAPPGVPSS